MSVALPQSRWHGMLQILRYNLPKFAGTGAAAVVAILAVALLPVPRPWRVLTIAGAAAALLWSASSLLVAHWIYDRSPLRRWEWLAGLLPAAPRRWTAVHAGLDETGGALQRTFGADRGAVLDVYDPVEMTEPSIARARRLDLDRAAAAADFRALPLADASQEAVFLVFAAHELRRPESRLRLFREIARALAPGGRLVVVEHLRDARNLLAFGPGFLHFLPRREWLRLGAAADLEPIAESRVTPFVAVLVWEKRP